MIERRNAMLAQLKAPSSAEFQGVLSTRPSTILDNCDQALPSWVKRQVFELKLRTNSLCTYHQDSGGEVRVLVEATDSGTVKFAVVDNGPGIVTADLEHIFDRYWRSRRDRGAGTGLGLYIATGIIEAHEGRLWAESVVGKGATFYFTLCAPPPV